MIETEPTEGEVVGSVLEEEIVNGVAFICRILLVGTAFGAAVIGVRLFSRGGAVAIASGSVNVPANYAWIIFAVLTLGHWTYERHLIRNIDELRDSRDPKKCSETVNRIKSQPNSMFAFGLIPRRPLKNGHFVPMDPSDPSAAFAFFALLVFLASMFPWYVTANGTLKWATGWALWLSIGAALILGLANWVLGTSWIVELSTLTPEEKRTAETTSSASSEDAKKPNIHYRGRSIINKGCTIISGIFLTTGAIGLLLLPTVGFVKLTGHLAAWPIWPFVIVTPVSWVLAMLVLIPVSDSQGSRDPQDSSRSKDYSRSTDSVGSSISISSLEGTFGPTRAPYRRFRAPVSGYAPHLPHIRRRH